ncbi:MAG: 50S ribosomal protein L13 [Nitrososphaerota archaeon]|nr:50S ribosomal protein L13 [Candidatus Geocrenenecus dongiae]
MISQAVSGRIVVDATNQRLGRMASRIAKLLLSGVEVVVVNAEKAIVTGSKQAILEKYLKLIRRRQLTSHKVVKVWYPRKPDRLVFYSIIRMLPRDKPRGREAVKKLKVYVGVPKEYEKVEKINFKEACLGEGMSRSGRRIRYMTIGEISRLISGGRSTV